MARIVDKGPGHNGKRWTVRYREPGGRAGRQREKSFALKRDALAFAVKVENDKRENLYIDPDAGRVPLHRYAEQWLASKSMAPGTAEAYERILRLHVLPHLGRKALAQVTAADVEDLYARWRQEGAAPGTVQSRRIVLSGLFSHAVRHRRIPFSPVREAGKPVGAVPRVDERNLPTFEEISALAKEIGPRLEPAVWLMAGCGLRIGESLGVFPEDISGGILRLRRQVIRVRDASGKYVARYAPLKHRQEGEWRDVPAPSSIASLADRLPIRSSSGGIPYPNLLRNSWGRAIRRLRMREYTPHDLRHKWATVTLSNGVPLHEVSRWMGHRSVRVTADCYGHLTAGGGDRCRQVLEAVLGGSADAQLP